MRVYAQWLAPWLAHFLQCTRDLKQKDDMHNYHIEGATVPTELSLLFPEPTSRALRSNKAWYPDQTSSPLRLRSQKCCSCSNKYLKIAVSKKVAPNIREGRPVRCQSWKVQNVLQKVHFSRLLARCGALTFIFPWGMLPGPAAKHRRRQCRSPHRCRTQIGASDSGDLENWWTSGEDFPRA